jgi:glucose-1-phosphate adenylyltransferase
MFTETVVTQTVESDEGRFVSKATRETLALILAGGRGTRLYDLTKERSKPAVSFAGKFRIIDFPLSNCLNSGIRRIGVLTQYNAHSLIRHLQKGWNFLRAEFGEFVEIWPAQQRGDEAHWYAGTADAVMHNLDVIRNFDPKYILILAGDHIYKMDYGQMIGHHLKSGADMTVGCLEVDLETAKSFGVMEVDEHGMVCEFAEKPSQPKPMPGNPNKALASMGIYVFSRDFLFQQLELDRQMADSSHDFGKDIIPRVIQSHKVAAYRFRDPSGEQGYWRDVGTVDAFWEANHELVGVTPPLNLYDKKWPIWTYQEQLPPAKFVFNDDNRRGMAVDSMVSGGCIISGSKLERSLLFSNVIIHSFSNITDSVLLPGVEVGRHCRIQKAVVDTRARIPPKTHIGIDLERDRKYFHVSEGGVVLVTQEGLDQMAQAHDR